MTTYAVYDLATGIFDGATLSVSGRIDPRRTMPGRGLYPGRVDHITQRLDLATGQLVPRDTPPAEPPEVLLMRARQQRQQLLAASDWTDTASAPVRLGAELYAQWQAYRQALRDLTTQPGWPAAVQWPVPPN